MRDFLSVYNWNPFFHIPEDVSGLLFRRGAIAGITFKKGFGQAA